MIHDNSKIMIVIIIVSLENIKSWLKVPKKVLTILCEQISHSQATKSKSKIGNQLKYISNIVQLWKEQSTTPSLWKRERYIFSCVQREKTI